MTHVPYRSSKQIERATECMEQADVHARGSLRCAIRMPGCLLDISAGSELTGAAQSAGIAVRRGPAGRGVACGLHHARKACAQTLATCKRLEQMKSHVSGRRAGRACASRHRRGEQNARECALCAPVGSVSMYVDFDLRAPSPAPVSTSWAVVTDRLPPDRRDCRAPIGTPLGSRPSGVCDALLTQVREPGSVGRATPT